MKVTITRPQEIEFNYLVAKMKIRYFSEYSYSKDNGVTWVESEYDDEKTDEEFKKHLPLVEDDYWKILIDLNDGRVINWPNDICVKTWFKVCDGGEYKFLNKYEEDVINITEEYDQYYVPDFLSLEDNGYGDYVYININSDGYIEHFELMKDRIIRYFNNMGMND